MENKTNALRTQPAKTHDVKKVTEYAMTIRRPKIWYSANLPTEEPSDQQKVAIPRNPRRLVA